MHQSTGQQRETQKVGRKLIEVRRVAIQRDTGCFFFTGPLLKMKKKVSDYIVNPIKKVPSVRISKASGIFRADQ